MDDLTIFANFFIDTEERFLRMKDSFLSFYKINPSKWVINIRGKFKNDAAKFLEYYLKENLQLSFRNSKRGWFYDTSQMLIDIETSYLFMWLEDHINIAPVNYFIDVCRDINKQSIDIFYYTFFDIDTRYNGLEMEETETIKYFVLDKENHSIMQRNVPGAYIIWYGAIIKNELFKKIIINPPDKEMRKFSIYTPFDFEKDSTSTEWLPLKTGIPKKEIFVSIDDNRKPGYCLQSRGQYPVREGRKSYACMHACTSEEKIFHHYNEDHNTTSASIIVPYILKFIDPKSVIDIGCGLGQWLYVFKKHGVLEILGIDGKHVPNDLRKIKEFYEFDLRNIKELKKSLISNKVGSGKKYDLCISLEVAEHLPEDLAVDFVTSLTEFSNCILFSAAIKNQTGENHINEQDHLYWIEKFKERSYYCYDIFRQKFWNNPSVNWWYRQNMYLFVKKGEVLAKNAKLWDGNMYIHPEMLNLYTTTVPIKHGGKKLKNKLYKIFRIFG